MIMFRGDLKPDLTVTLTDGEDDAAVDLTAATAIRVIGKKDGVKIFDRAPTGTPGVDGVVVMQWLAADTDEAGVIAIEVEVMWPNTKPQTFRPTGSVRVLADYA